jgi:hypothetical protein
MSWNACAEHERLGGKLTAEQNKSLQAWKKREAERKKREAERKTREAEEKKSP